MEPTLDLGGTPFPSEGGQESRGSGSNAEPKSCESVTDGCAVVPCRHSAEGGGGRGGGGGGRREEEEEVQLRCASEGR